MSLKDYPNISERFTFNPATQVERPLFSDSVSAGIPIPAEDYVESMLDLNDHLIQNTDTTFFVRVSGDSMIEAGINHGDILVVDASIQPTHGKVVIAMIDNELTVKTLERIGTKVRLLPANPDYEPIQITGDIQFDIHGVATSVIHSL